MVSKGLDSVHRADAVGSCSYTVQWTNGSCSLNGRVFDRTGALRYERASTETKLPSGSELATFMRLQGGENGVMTILKKWEPSTIKFGCDLMELNRHGL